MLICLVGLSGSGKSQIESFMVDKLKFKKVVSYTTRKPRKGEKNGIDYKFIDDEKANNIIKTKNYIEYEKVYDNYYITPRINMNENNVIVVSLAGALELKKHGAKIIFINTCLDELAKRMRERGDDAENIDKRLFEDEEKMNVLLGNSSKFDLIVHNNIEIENAYREIEKYVKYGI